MELMNTELKPKSASNLQKEELVSIFEEYQQKAKLENLDDSKERQKFWTEATQRLNKIEGGTVKSCSKWVKYWADVLINLRRKCRLVVEGRSKRIGPTPFEVRIMRVGNLYDVLEQWTKAVESTNEMTTLENVEEEYYPEDTGVQKEEIVVENYSEDPLDEEFVAFAKPVEETQTTHDVHATAQLHHIRKQSTETYKQMITPHQTEYVELTTLHNATSEFLRPKSAVMSEPQERLKENLKRTTEKLETVMKKRKIDDSQFAIAQALTNMSAAILALSNSLNELAHSLTNGSMS